ncbi:MAG: hypothetical protein FWB96_13505 [Defluviitaleaceae bacterium]|nr:hypothetical protein [Defluviitaleaceae bacterium]MCL2264337.1 hypothetical protein [Defluviitaleaceae bacterium]
MAFKSEEICNQVRPVFGNSFQLQLETNLNVLRQKKTSAEYVTTAKNKPKRKCKKPPKIKT